MEVNDTSLRDDIASAVEAAEKTETVAPTAPIGDTGQKPPEVTPAIGETPPAPAPPKDGKPRDDQGRFAKAAPAPDAIKAPEPPKEGEKPPEGAQATPPAEPTPTPEPEKPKIAPPRALRATTREGWSNIPREMQEDISRWDKEIQKVMSESAQARQMTEKFKETVGPYEHLFRAEGVEPLQGIGNLMRTTAALATGTPQTKAQIVTNIIKTYGIDIPTLDAMLAGAAIPNSQTPQAAPYDPRVDKLLSELEQAKLERQQTLESQAQAALADIENEEFFEDVRMDMADLLEVASRRGLPLTPRDAYNRAIMLNPDISRVIEQRKNAASQSGAQRSMAAGASIKPQPTVPVSGSGDRDLRSEIEASIEKLSRR